MKSRKKNLKRLFVVSLAMAVGGAVYVHFGILPGRARDYAIEKLEAITHKKIRFEKALWMPFHGLIFYGLDVREKNDTPVFSTRRFALDVKLLPFLREKKIVVNNVFLDGPVFDYVAERRKIVVAPPVLKTEISGQIRVPTVEDEKKPTLEDILGGPDSFLPENVYIEQIQISDGYITIRRAEGAAPEEVIRDIHVRLAFRKPPFLRFDGSLRLGENVYAEVNLNGVWDLSRASYEFNLLTDWLQIPGWLKDYQKNHFLQLQDGHVKLAIRLRSVGEEKALFDANADLRDSEIRVRSAQYEGRLRIKAKGLFNFITKKIDRYQGSLELLDMRITDLSPQINEVQHVEGGVDFQPDLLTVRSLRGNFAGVPFNAMGTVTSFRDLKINGQIYTRTGVDKILGLIPPERKKMLKDLIVSGECEATTLLTGSLKDSGGATVSYKLSLHDGTIAGSDRKWKLSAVCGDLSSEETGLTASNVSFDYNEKTYNLEFSMPKTSETAGRFSIKTEELSLQTSYRWREDRVDLENARLSAPGVTARFDGFFCPRPPLPTVDVHGHANLDLAAVTKSYSDKAPWLKSWPLTGSLAGEFSYRGPWNDPAFSEITLDAQGTAISVKKAKLEDPVISAVFKSARLMVSHLNAKAYRGMMGFKGNFDFMDSETGFEGDFYANDIDLRALTADIEPENKKRSGTLILQLSMRGKLKDPNTYAGKGSISVKDGYLMETDRFKAMGQLPLVRVEGLDVVVFHDMSAAFEMRQKRFWTDRLTLLSDTVHLELSGSVGFNQDLDMLMDIQYTNAVLLGAEDAGGLAPMMVSQAQDFISQYRVSGTLKDPHYEKVGAPVAGAVTKKIGGLIRNLTS